MLKVSINKQWSQGVEKEMQVGLLDLTTTVHSRSNVLTPKDTRALVNSGNISPIADGYKITYGSDRVPYARRQFYENRRSSHWLTKAADSVVRGSLAKYFRIGK